MQRFVLALALVALLALARPAAAQPSPVTYHSEVGAFDEWEHKGTQVELGAMALS